MDNVRPATAADANSILEIYRPHVLENAISFETVMPSSQEMQNRIRETSEKYPWIVLERSGKILGYAYAGAFRTRAAYAWSLESTVYVAAEFAGQGIGKKLYQELLRQLKDQGAVNVLGVITLPNEASLGLHRSLGFHEVGRLKNIGFKFGKWWDVGYWQLELQATPDPKPLGKPKG